MFPVKNWHSKFSFLSFSKFAIFAKFFKKKSCLSFLLMSGICHSMEQSDLFIFDNVIHITVMVLSIRIIVFIGS